MTAAAAGRPAWPTRPGLLLAIDGRRPASWLALVAAAIVVPVVSLLPIRTPELVAFVAGGLLAVAACGSLPRELMGGGVGLWLTERAGWPLVGVAVACGGLLLGRTGEVGSAAGAVCAGVVAAAVTILVPTRRGVHAADAASLAVAVVCGAALLAGGVLRLLGPGDVAVGAAGLRMLLTVTGMWLAIALLAIVVARGVESAAATFATPPAGATAAGPVRLALLWMAMVTSLAGMVTCFFLAPELAGWYPLLVLAWFTSLALPQATLLMGDGEAAAWRRLLESIRGSSFAALGCRAAATIGGLLGWPAVVAIMVRTTAPSGGGEQVVPAAVLSLVGLAGATAVVALAGFVTSGSRPARETALAAACVVFVAALLAAAGLPGLPGLPRSGP